MGETHAIEARIDAALERIGQGVEGLGAAVAQQEASALRAALEDERLANAQLNERVKAIKDRQETTVAELEGQVRRLGKMLAAQEAAMAELRETSETLRENNAALRAANAAGQGEPELVEAGAAAELEALRAERTAQKAEMDEILSELETLIAEDGNA